MPLPFQNYFQKLLDKFSTSRDFTISFFLHLLLVVIFGTTVLFQAVTEPPDFEGESGGFVAAEENNTPQEPVTQPQQTTFNVQAVTPPQTSTPLTAITTSAQNPLNFSMSATTIPSPVSNTPTEISQSVAAPKAPSVSGDQMTTAQASQIKSFTGGWGKGTGSGTGLRQREFEFTAYIGQYQGGNWNSTVRVQKDKITGGSLPNLLYIINKWSKDKIKTNDKNVVALKLDSDEIFAKKPPFIFLTGTRDFKLTDQEVENLQKYVRSGGCIWGDSSLPGLRSRFDIAFRREMRRVIPDVDKDFEPLPKDHPIYTKNYYPEIKETPPGLNYYREPIFALKIYGEIAVIYTANDYGDMWQIGLTDKGEVDLRRNQNNEFVAINPGIWASRNSYLGNISPPPGKKPNEPVVATNLVDTYKFGTNIILHLLTRWESKTARAPDL
ncbi:MAG TPA: DUF4159 domain-containing protein [Chthoniobacterales bacterium]